jgi:hypothetical protein
VPAAIEELRDRLAIERMICDLATLGPLEDRLGMTRIRRVRQHLREPATFGGYCGDQSMAA